jgi:hypothetical protein
MISRYWTGFVIFCCVLLFGLSCSTSNDKKIASENFEEVFNENKEDYVFIKDFILHNTDSITTIRIKQDTVCQISKEQLKNALGDYILISIEDKLRIKSSKVRASLNHISSFMIKHGISYIGRNKNKVQISFKYSGTPCFNLFWEKEISNNENGVVIEYVDKGRNFWKYYIDSNWYIKGIPCFN